MRSILLTTDFSDASERAFPKTANLAKRLGVGITLAHVVVDLLATPHGAPLAPPQSDPSVTDEIAEAKKQLATLAGQFEDVAVETEVLSGEHVARTVADYAKEHDVEMIALSTHGRTGFRHMILGSVAEEILRHATVPVLTFPAEPS